MEARFNRFNNVVSQRMDSSLELSSSHFARQTAAASAFLEQEQQVFQSTRQEALSQREQIDKFHQDFNGNVAVLTNHLSLDLDQKTEMTRSLNAALHDHSAVLANSIHSALNNIVHSQRTSAESIQAHIASTRKNILEAATASFASLRCVHENSTDLAKHISENSANNLGVADRIAGGCDKHVQNMSSHLEACHFMLQGNDLHQDVSTGKTPRKKIINIPSDWSLTKPRDELISEFQEKENRAAAETVPSTPSSKLPQFRPKRGALQELE
ncbi:hypothetical protein HDU91_006108 [Kappamyces sp. JEL0680]|nr:hypothetical protein HDU91_006108 [Kappamyces sp. JEL0680]